MEQLEQLEQLSIALNPSQVSQRKRRRSCFSRTASLISNPGPWCILVHDMLLVFVSAIVRDCTDFNSSIWFNRGREL